MQKPNEREQSYIFFLEEKEYENKLFDRVMNCDIEEIGIYLTSDIPEERWLAKWRLSRKQSKRGKDT